jgi:hypothetical protein
MESDPLLTALSKLEQKLDEFSNKIVVLDEKVDSVQSFTNDLHNNS